MTLSRMCMRLKGPLMSLFFESDMAVAALVEAFLACTLPKAGWTHAAHFATALWLIDRCPEMMVERDMPGLIRRYNESVGGVNDDHNGYHETITQASLHMARRHLRAKQGEPIHLRVDSLMASPLGNPDWLLDHWTRETLFSVGARRGWIAPDRSPLPA